VPDKDEVPGGGGPCGPAATRRPPEYRPHRPAEVGPIRQQRALTLIGQRRAERRFHQRRSARRPCRRWPAAPGEPAAGSRRLPPSCHPARSSHRRPARSASAGSDHAPGYQQQPRSRSSPAAHFTPYSLRSPMVCVAARKRGSTPTCWNATKVMTESRSTASTSPAHGPRRPIGGSHSFWSGLTSRGPPVPTPPPTSWRDHLPGCSSQAWHAHVPARRPAAGAGRRSAEHHAAARPELDAAAPGIE
jgi:hypothetical protein